MTFLGPRIIRNLTDGSQKEDLNEALLFHESLHGYYGVQDLDLERLFEEIDNPGITYYLENNILVPDFCTCMTRQQIRSLCNVQTKLPTAVANRAASTRGHTACVGTPNFATGGNGFSILSYRATVTGMDQNFVLCE